MQGGKSGYTQPPVLPDDLARHAQCFADCGWSSHPAWSWVGSLGLLTFVVGTLAYGFWLVAKPASPLRTTVKTMTVTGLLAIAFVWGSPWLLLAALSACIVGDFLLAVDSRKLFPLALVAFLAGHILYIVLFLAHLDPAMEPSTGAHVGWLLLAIGCLAALAYMWNHVGALRPAVVLYTLIIASMAGVSFLLGGGYWAAMVGSVAFVMSDTVLAIDHFRDKQLFGSRRATDWAVWFLYVTAQLGIVTAFMGRL